MYLMTAPTIEPVTVAEAKFAARISGSEFDAQLPAMIAAARQLAEQGSGGRQFMEQTWRVELSDWPAVDDVFHVHEVTTTAVAYWDGSAWITMGAGTFTAFKLGEWTAIAPALNTSWPTLGAIAGGPRVRIDLTAGAESAAEVPPCVAMYIKAMVAFWIDNPAAASGASLAEAPFLRSLLDPVKLY